MKMTITMTANFMGFKTGDVLDVINDSNEKAIVCESKGRRAIIPRSKCEVAKPDPDTIKDDDDSEETNEVLTEKNIFIVDDTDMKVLAHLQVPYRDKDTAAGISEDNRIDELCNALDNRIDMYIEIVESGEDSVSKDTEDEEEFSVSASMSTEEVSVLSEILGITQEDTSKVDSSAVEVGGKLYKKLRSLPDPIIPELTSSQVYLSQITGNRLPESGIDHIIDVYPDDHWDEENKTLIPTVDVNYRWDPNVLEALVLSHITKERIMLSGLPGTGKTTAVTQFSAWVRQPFTRIGGRGDMETSSLVGYQDVDIVHVDVGDGKTLPVNEMNFKYGMLSRAVKFGHCTVIDEAFKIPPHIQMAMQHLYEYGGSLTVDDIPGTAEDKIITPPDSFMLCLTDNVKGTGDDFHKFGATQIQDTSTLDRIGLNVNVDYMDIKDERLMLTKMFPTADKSTVTKLIKFAGLVRNGYKADEIALTLSPRGLITMLRLITRFNMNVKSAIKLCYLNKIADDNEIEAIKKYMTTVGI